MGLYIELPEEWTKWSLEVTDVHDNQLEPKIIDENFDLVRCGECKHRDPEDKKCDCGQMERQGCIFPVSDDYSCKYGERRNEMTNEDIARIKEELAHLEESDEQKEKNKFNSQLHMDVLKRVGYTNDQAVALIGTILDAVCIAAGLDANKSAKKMAHDLGMSIEEE